MQAPAKERIIALSGETVPDIINEAYALGANCYAAAVPF
jgi:hypothetical protein